MSQPGGPSILTLTPLDLPGLLVRLRPRRRSVEATAATAPIAPRPFGRRWSRRALLAVATLLLAGLGYLGAQQLTGNFHAVVPGQCYRSAQLTPSQLADRVKQHGIRAVLNLRGANPKLDWYQAELAESQRLGIEHLDFRMSSRTQLSQAKANELIEIMRRAPKPLLIHCNSGSDRSGLAAALYLAAVEGAGEEAAEGQLSIYYGHFSVPFLGAYAMDETFEEMEPALGFEGS